jgi:hypothetical protein
MLSDVWLKRQDGLSHASTTATAMAAADRTAAKVLLAMSPAMTVAMRRQHTLQPKQLCCLWKIPAPTTQHRLMLRPKLLLLLLLVIPTHPLSPGWLHCAVHSLSAGATASSATAGWRASCGCEGPRGWGEGCVAVVLLVLLSITLFLHVSW